MKTELLAPAGSLASFFAALENGADAVYCGLTEFSARAKAKNFTLAEVEQLVRCTRGQGRRLYVALNTLVKEKELSRLVETLAALAAIRVDGVIIQDLGVWRLIRDHFPELPLHASTQMTIHNAAGIRMLEKMGFVRAVLARELSLAEIADIRRQTTIELEHFVHGALCFAFSGQCYFSSFLTGMSGNRGRCAQPCRRRYDDGRKTGYLFSTSDLAAIELLPELIRAGVRSFKIEGRMKSPDYVARVVTAYRLVLDAPADGRREALQEAAEHLDLSFGRQRTRGFLTGFVPAAIADSSRHGSQGLPLGEVVSLRDGMIGFHTATRLHVGDRIRVQPQNDQVGTGFAVRVLVVEGRKTKSAAAGDFVQVSHPGRGMIHIGDWVFKVGGKIFFTKSPEACRRMLDEQWPARFPGPGNDAMLERLSLALAALLPGRGARPAESREVTLKVRRVEEIFSHGSDAVSRFELPLTPKNLAGLKKYARQLASRKNELIWELPPLLFAGQWDDFRGAVQMLLSQGYATFRIQNLGQIPLFDGMEKVNLVGGFRCYAMNSQAALAWRELGLAELTVSLEDDRNNLRDLAARLGDFPLAVMVFGPLPILLSRIPVRGVRPGGLVRSDREDGYRLFMHDGITEVVAEQDFSLLGRLAELGAMGIGRLVVDQRRWGMASARGRAVLAALADDVRLDETTSFNYERGLT